MHTHNTTKENKSALKQLIYAYYSEIEALGYHHIKLKIDNLIKWIYISIIQTYEWVVCCICTMWIYICTFDVVLFLLTSHLLMFSFTRTRQCAKRDVTMCVCVCKMTELWKTLILFCSDEENALLILTPNEWQNVDVSEWQSERERHLSQMKIKWFCNWCAYYAIIEAQMYRIKNTSDDRERNSFRTTYLCSFKKGFFH